MNITGVENEVLKDFHLLADYLKKKEKIQDLSKYKNDFSAFLLHAHHIKAYDFIAPFCKNKRILDIGCFIGYGETRIYSQANEIIAIDIDSNALEFARKNRKFQNVEFKDIDVTKLPFSNKTFDIIIAFHVIEHIHPDEVSNFLEEVKRALKKEGLFFIVTPNRRFRLLPFQKPFNPEHYQEFTAKAFKKTLKKTFNNFQIKGFRAAEWIEEIERNRVRISPYRVLNTILPKRIINLLKKLKFKLTKLYQNESKKTSVDNNLFSTLFRRFSMDDFYLEEQENLIDKSIDIVGICKNE